MIALHSTSRLSAGADGLERAGLGTAHWQAGDSEADARSAFGKHRGCLYTPNHFAVHERKPTS